MLSSFSQQFDKAGKTAEADGMRGVSRQMFEKLLGVPPAQVSIGPDGRISGLGVSAGNSISTGATPQVNPASSGSTVGKAPRGAGLRGVWRADWVATSYGVGGMQLLAHNQTLSFDNEGDFIPDLPSGKSLSPADLRAIAAASPNKGGRYEVEGEQVTLRYLSGTTEKVTLHRVGGQIQTITYWGKIMGPKIIPPDGTRLSRTYGTERITQTGLASDAATSTVSGSSVIAFAADGRFSYGSTVTFSGQRATGVTKHPQVAGQYEIKDGALTLREDGGQTTTYFIWTEDKDLATIFLNNALYK